MTTIYTITAIIAFIIIFVCITGYDWTKALRSPILTLAVPAFIVRIIAMQLHPGFETDLNCFKSWAGMLYDNGFSSFYTMTDTFTDYPPGYMYVLYMIGMLRSLLHLEWNSFAFELLIRLPAISCDILTGLLIYRLSLKVVKSGSARLIALAYLLNPAIIIDSTVWGQVDSVYSLLILSSVCYIAEIKSQGKQGADIRLLYSFLLYAAAILVKPQAFIFAPVYLYAAFEAVAVPGFSKSSCLKVLKWILISGIFIFIGMLPFTVHFDFRPIINQYIQTIQSYPYATVNAYNFYGFLGANWRPVTDKLFFFTFSTWGMLFIDAIVFLSIFLLNRNRTKSNVFFVAGLINALVFMFSARMHERYLYPSLALFLVAFLYAKNKKLLLLYAGYSLTFFVNCADILNLFTNGADYALIKTSMPFVSLLNMIITGLLLYTAFHLSEKTTDTTEERPEKSDNLIVLPVDTKVFHHENTKRLSKITGRDLLLMAGLMVIYSTVAFVNLGNRESPQTVWTAQRDAEVVVSFPETEDIHTVQFMLGARHNKSFMLSTSQDGMYYDEGIMVQGESVFAWKNVLVGATGKYVKIQALDDELMIQEMAFCTTNGQLIPIQSISSSGEALFDEQLLVPVKNSFMNSTYFDEIYHARTAYEFIHRLSVYEWTHPPLGKVLIAAGISLFGMTPFGWRFTGTLFGVLMIPLMYCFGKKMFGSWKWAFFSAFIFAFDFMHFAQTRIATIDTYVTFFIIGMYYFMFIYYKMSFYRDKLIKTLIPLGLSGLCMALAIASKWPGIYAGGGLAIIFFHSFYMRTREFMNDRRLADGNSTERYPRYAAITIGSCFIFFVAVPIFIYSLSYIPYLRTPGMNGINSILSNQQAMYSYHAYLESEHPYSSSWWSWPFNWRPIFYYVENIKNGVRAGINSMGNPAVWWCGIVAVFYCISVQSNKRDRTSLFLLISLAAQYLPWILVGRTTYIYHYFPSIPFLVLMITYFFKNFVVNKHKYFPVAYAVLVLLLFGLFYPVLSGMPISIRYVEIFLRWLPSWQLI